MDTRDDMNHPEEEEAYLQAEDILHEINPEEMAPAESDAEVDSDHDMDGGDDKGKRREGDPDEQTMEDAPIQDDSLMTFNGHSTENSVYCVEINPTNPRMVASGGGDDVGYLWDIQNAQPFCCLKGHKDTIADIQFNHDGKLLATAGLDSIVNVWSAENGSLISTLDGPGEGVDWIDWHPKGNVVLGGSSDATCWMWNAMKGVCLQVFSGHGEAVTSGGFTPDGKKVVTISQDASLRVWDPRSAKCVHAVSGHGFHGEAVTTLAFHNNSMIVLTGSTDGTVVVTNLQTGKPVSVLAGHVQAVEDAAFFTGPNSWAATGSLDGSVKIWDIQHFQDARAVLKGHREGVTKVVWHKTEPILYSASCDDTVKVWDTRTNECVRTFQGHHDMVLDLAVSADGKTVVTVSDDGTSKVFVL